MSLEFALANYMVLRPPSGEFYRFQNFSIQEIKRYRDLDWSFLPFGFSGVTVNRQGDNVDADILLPNNELSRPWGVEAIKARWIVRVDTVKVSTEGDEPEKLFHYVGQVNAGDWNSTALTLRLNTVLDAVGAEFPHRTINEQLCGALPTTSNVRV